MTQATPLGGADWLGTVLRLYERPLVGYALRLLREIESARDAVQDVFLRLCRKPIALDDPRLGPWLYRVCRNRAIDHLRKERAMHRLDEAFAPPATTDSPPEAAARQEEAGRLRTTLATLPARQQEVVWLRFRGGLSYREIAEVCATSAGNVGVMLHTAIKTLRGRLAEAPVPLGSKEVT